MRISDWSSDVCSSDLIEYFRSKRFTSRISDPPKVAPRPIAINAVSSAAKLAGEASSSDPLAQALSAKRAALLKDGQATAPAERTEPVMRALTGDELSRSEERRVGNEGVSTFRSRWSPYHEKTHTHQH